MPETARAVDWGVVDFIAANEGLSQSQCEFSIWGKASTHIIDVAERILRRYIVNAVGQIRSEQLLLLGDIALSHHVLNRGVDWSRLDCVDCAKCKATETITLALDEGVRDTLSELDSLTLDGQATDDNSICADTSLRGRAITVLDLLALT